MPKMPSMKIVDFAKVIAPDAKVKEIGIRKNEKLHECLITMEEAKHMTEKEDYYILNLLESESNNDPWVYYSDTNDMWLSKEELRELINE